MTMENLFDKYQDVCLQMPNVKSRVFANHLLATILAALDTYGQVSRADVFERMERARQTMEEL